MSDDDYRAQLVKAGANLEEIRSLSGHDLDCVGNILRSYRTSMREQNQAAFEIQRYQESHRGGK